MNELAVNQALQSFRVPGNRKSKNVRIPDEGMLDVIKMAAGEPETLERIAHAVGTSQDFLTEASRHYLRTLITGRNHTPQMILGLSSDLSKDTIKLHKRWLLKWLHPDRNSSTWEAALFKKVSVAADMLENGVAETKPALEGSDVFKRAKQPSSQQLPRGKSSVAYGKHKADAKLKRKWRVLVQLVSPLLAVVIIAISADAMLKHWYSREGMQAFTASLFDGFKGK